MKFMAEESFGMSMFLWIAFWLWVISWFLAIWLSDWRLQLFWTGAFSLVLGMLETAALKRETERKKCR